MIARSAKSKILPKIQSIKTTSNIPPIDKHPTKATLSKMAPPRRKVLETVEETLTPPNQLTASQQIARVTKATGNNVYLVELPSKESILVELSARFRSTIWMKRGSYVLVDFDAIQDRDNKLKGEIVNIVRDEKQWRKEPYW